MRKSVSLAVLLLLSACDRADNRQQQPQDLKSLDVSEEVAMEPVQPVSAPPGIVAGPQISPTATPGVAFNYRYAFRLPGQKIARVQEQHAQACEKLGIDRCRITGMRYRLVNDTDVEATLAFKLDPAIAREFGKAGIAIVAGNDGMLVDSEISGVDAGAAITVANRTDAQLNEDLARIEAQLARSGLPAAERDRLQYEAQQLRQSIRANRAGRDEQRESLATTPMVFNYGSGDLVPGFDTHSPMRKAFEEAGDNLIGGVAALFVITATLLPWALLLLLLWWLFRRLAPKFRSSAARAPDTEDQAGG